MAWRRRAKETHSNASNHRWYGVTDKSLDAAGYNAEPLLIIARNGTFLCIWHSCMATRRHFVACLGAQVGNHPLEVARGVRKILYGNRCGVWLWAHNAPDGEEVHNLFLAWEHSTPRRTARGIRLWVYKHCDALCTRRFRLCHALRVNVVGDVFWEPCFVESGMPYLLFHEEVCDTMLESADVCGVGLATVSGDVVEITNYILEKGYNGHISKIGVQERVPWNGKQWLVGSLGMVLYKP